METLKNIGAALIVIPVTVCMAALYLSPLVGAVCFAIWIMK